MQHFDLAIIGGGIVGLATARALLSRNPKLSLVLIEKESRLAHHQTGRNSGVIHSGLYYKPGSLKALTCRRGYDLLVDYCRSEGIAHDLCGKIVVATDEAELPRLQTLFERGEANGLRGLSWLNASQIHDHEPHATGIRALHVPQTGIVDYRQFSESLGDAIRQRGGEIRLSERVLRIKQSANANVIETDRGELSATQLCSCAGLHSDRMARQTEPELPLRIVPFRGEYYQLAERSRHLVRNLIYPVPDPAFPFLGVHFTRMIDGGVEAGPNAVLALSREGYDWSQINLRDLGETLAWPGFWTLARKYWRTGCGEVHRSLSKSAFTQALRRLLPDLDEDDLEPASSGVRAQACHRDGALLDDFHFVQRGRVLHVCNAPSPAATASLAIGEAIADRLGN